MEFSRKQQKEEMKQTLPIGDSGQHRTFPDNCALTKALSRNNFTMTITQAGDGERKRGERRGEIDDGEGWGSEKWSLGLGLEVTTMTNTESKPSHSKFQQTLNKSVFPLAHLFLWRKWWFSIRNESGREEEKGGEERRGENRGERSGGADSWQEMVRLGLVWFVSGLAMREDQEVQGIWFLAGSRVAFFLFFFFVIGHVNPTGRME